VLALVERLQPVYSKGPQRDEHVRLAQLRHIANRNDETLVVYKTSLQSTMWFLAFACLGAGVGALFAHDQNWMLAWLFWSLALMLTLGALIAFGGRGSPCLTLSPYGLLLPNLPQPMPWTAISDYSIKARWTLLSPGGSLPNTLILQLSDEYPVRGFRLPRFSSTYSSSKHQFQLFLGDHLRLDNGVVVEEVREFAKFVEYFLTYWRAGLARAELSQMGGD